MSYAEQPLLSTSEESTLHNRGYKLLKKLGEGSYAKVFLCEYKTPETFAKGSKAPPSVEKGILGCKLIDTDKAPKDFVRKFLPRELDILVRLNHPHIIHVHSILQRNAKYFIFMRFAENGDVLDYVLKNGAIAENQARIWFRQVMLAIQYLHEMEVAHRDIKCENILVTSNFNIKIADFGFAREVIDSRCNRVLSETYCGSLAYAAPEIIKGSPYNPKMADIWACGIVLYVMLNKAMPFDDSNVKTFYEQQLYRRWNFRPKIVDTLSIHVQSLETHILEPDVNKRWRVEQILSSDWMAMDLRLLKMSELESEALKKATEVRRRRCEGEDKKDEKRGSSIATNLNKSKSQKPMSSVPDVPTSSKRSHTSGQAGRKDDVTVYKDVRMAPLNASDETTVGLATENTRNVKKQDVLPTPPACDVGNKQSGL